MPHENLDLPDDAARAVELLREASRGATAVVFKKSPICPVSHYAEQEFRGWLESRGDEGALVVAEVDVIARRPLARGLTEELGIAHQSPQALVFKGGELAWHGSHHDLTEATFREAAGAPPAGP